MEQNRDISGLSVFAVASCFVYLITTLESAPYIGRAVSFYVRQHGVMTPLELPGLWLPVTIFHTLIAARLYAHAWAVDQSSAARLEASNQSAALRTRVLLLTEWSLRGFWVALVSYLPTTFSKVANNQRIFLIESIEIYYIVTFGAVFAWDILMFRHIVDTRSRFAFVNRGPAPRVLRIRQLKWRWVGVDFVLLMASISLYLLQREWIGAWENWKAPVFFIFLSCSGGLCIMQLFIWVPEIRSAES